MVKTVDFIYLFRILCVCVWICFPGFSFAQEIKVSAEVDRYQVRENQPVKGLIEVTHPKNMPIDSSQFKIDGKPLRVQFIKDADIGDNGQIIVSIFTFELPPVPKGLHLLSPISITVNGAAHESISSTYSVESGESAVPPASAQNSQPASGDVSSQAVEGLSPYLKIEQFVEGSEPIYPGQHLKIVVRYLYRGDIELAKEQVPLLGAEGFLKIGQKEVKDTEEADNISMSQISQVVEAMKPGTYRFDKSVIKGKSFIRNAYGRRQYYTDLKSETPPMEIRVLPFPLEGKPASFDSAIGQFTFSVAMQTPPTVRVGDKVTLAVNIEGETSDWNTVRLSDLCCQPGFTGLFKMSDLPSTGQLKDNAKQFIVEIRPLTGAVKAVPPIEFSYFDPKKKGYVVLRSSPIPIQVLPKPIKEEAKGFSSSTPSQAIPTKQELQKLVIPSPIEIRSNFSLQASDLHNLSFSDMWFFLFIPLGIGLLYFQVRLKESIEATRRLIKTKTAQELFNRALNTSPGSSEFYQILTLSFLVRLMEIGSIPSAEISWQELPLEGVCGDVRAYLSKVEEARFAEYGKLDQQQMILEAKVLFEELQPQKKNQDE